MFPQRFQELYNGVTDHVGQNQTEYFQFAPHYSTVVASVGFDGCIGVVVAAPKGCIVGHASPTQAQLVMLEQKLKDYADSYPGVLYNRDLKVYIYVAVERHNHSKVKYAANVAMIKQYAQALFEVPPVVKTYIEAQQGPHGALVVKCRQNALPTVEFIKPGEQL